MIDLEADVAKKVTEERKDQMKSRCYSTIEEERNEDSFVVKREGKMK